MQEAALHLAFVVFIVCLAQTAMIESHNICVHMHVYTCRVYVSITDTCNNIQSDNVHVHICVYTSSRYAPEDRSLFMLSLVV